MPKPTILLADHDRYLVEPLAEFLRSEGFDVRPADRLQKALSIAAKTEVDLVLAEVHLPDGDGFQLLDWFQQHQPDTPVLLMADYGTIDTAVEAMRRGAHDYLVKPILAEELKVSLERALTQRRLRQENQQLRKQLEGRQGLECLIGRDPRMLQVYELVEAVADTKTTVLITGESGTGKTLTARAIHRLSRRRHGPFVEVACGALPETLLESELFGHKAGAFTGAVSDRKGKFALADGGTIFLDEIATATPALQVKLLRVLQSMEFEPLGGSETIRVDARVVLATNQNLEQLVREGKFREDLYYRIHVVTIHLPPLRERISDIPLLADHFLHKYVQETGRNIKGFTREAMDLLQSYSWPGNIRELENAVERAVVLCRSEWIEPRDLPPTLRTGVTISSAPTLPSSLPQGRGLKAALQDPERKLILAALEAHNWNKQKAARALGINRATLYKKMRRLGLNPSMPKPVAPQEPSLQRR
jgi:DNA-binding NtrC family response regulator